jgi:hypothetical protein
MFFYNLISEFDSFQVLISISIFLIINVITFLLLQPKINLKSVLFIVLTGTLISLFSAFVVNGGPSGMSYYERFGYPLEYFYVTRNIADSISIYMVAEPSAFGLKLIKFIGNSIFWALVITIPTMFYLSNLSKNKKIIAIALCPAFVTLSLLTVSYLNEQRSLENYMSEAQSDINSRTNESDPPTIDPAVYEYDSPIGEGARINAIEKEYPEFKDYENWEETSMTPRRIKSEQDENDFYFAYIQEGSGVPIAQATCFRVNRSLEVFKIGTFPDNLDSYSGYTDIDPKNCIGIR